MDYSRGLAVDPGGTAIRADRVVLVETPLPWPKPVFDHAYLTALTPILKGSLLPTRTLAYVPDNAEPVGADPARTYPATIIALDRLAAAGIGRESAGGLDVFERRFHPTSADEALRIARALATNDRETLDELADHKDRLVTPMALVCTQGSHDVCCGSEGARFAAEADTVAGLRVFRVSHTGGHRFAPTAMTLPDGRMWADLDLDLLRSIVSRTGDTADLVDRCRGWWGADTGGAQVAERAIFGAVGWDLDERERTVEEREYTVEEREHTDEEGAVSDDATRFAVSSGGQAWSVTVAVGRAVPTIACRQPGGLPAKQSVEYEVREIVAD